MNLFSDKKGRVPFRLNVTISLIALNVVFFILFFVLTSQGILNVDSIALKPSNILQGENLWTIITSMFMHGGFFHLFVNMITIFFVGSLTEKILGSKRYLGFYLLAGIFASLFFVASAFVLPGLMNSPAVGASGALFGIIGLLVILTPNLPVYAMFIPIPIKLKYAGPGLLALLWLVSLGANINIGNTAHLGGLIAGLLYGLFLRHRYKRQVEMIKMRHS